MFNCTNNKAKSPELSFYLKKIPSQATEPERRVLWLKAINRGTREARGKLFLTKQSSVSKVNLGCFHKAHFSSILKSLKPINVTLLYVCMMFPFIQCYLYH